VRRRLSASSSSASTSCSRLWMGWPSSPSVLISKSLRLALSLSNSNHMKASTRVVFPVALSPYTVTSPAWASRTKSRTPLKLLNLRRNSFTCSHLRRLTNRSNTRYNGPASHVLRAGPCVSARYQHGGRFFLSQSRHGGGAQLVCRCQRL